MALPNFRGYYWAANVHKITHWMQSPGTDWCELEGRSCMSSSLQALASSNLPIKISQFTSNPVVISTFKIWSQLRRHTNLKDTLDSHPTV